MTTRRSCPFYLSILIVAVFALSARADKSRIEDLSPGAEPVPQELLSGLTLIVPAHGFAVLAPSAEWTWFTAQVPEKHRSVKERFLAFHAETERFIEVQAIRLDFPALDENNVRSLLSQMLTKVAGADPSSLRYSPLPDRSDAYRYSYEVRDGDERVAVQGAVIRSNRLFMLTMGTPDEAEIATFDSFVNSFKLVDTKGQQPSVAPESLVRNPSTVDETRLDQHPAFAALYWVVLLGTYGIAVSLRSSTGVPRYNPGRVAMAAIALTWLVRYAEVSASIEAHFGSGGIGTALGAREFGRALLPFIVAAILSARHKRRLRRSGNPTTDLHGTPAT